MNIATRYYPASGSRRDRSSRLPVVSRREARRADAFVAQHGGTNNGDDRRFSLRGVEEIVLARRIRSQPHNLDLIVRGWYYRTISRR